MKAIRLLVIVLLSAATVAAVISMSRAAQRAGLRKIAARDAVEPAKLHDRIVGGRIVLLGETHGRPEVPAFVTSLLFDLDADGHFTHLAIESSADTQSLLDRFFAGDDNALDELKASHHGVRSATNDYFAVFPKIREFNHDHPRRAIKVLAIDVPGPVRSTAEEARDRHMFDVIEEVLDDEDARVLVYVGADHAAKTGATPYRGADGRTYPLRTLGSLLNERYPRDTTSVRVLSQSDPLYVALDGPAAIRFTPNWPSARSLMSLEWTPDAKNPSPTVDRLFDYAIRLPAGPTTYSSPATSPGLPR